MKRDKYMTIKMLIASQEHFLDNIKSILEKNSVKLQNYRFEKDIQKNEIVYNINVKYEDERMLVLATDDMTKEIKGIKRLGWE